VEDRERYKYPMPPNDHLSATLSLSKCGTAAPTKTVKIGKVELTILAEV
jgi:hypothetical protein